MNPYAAIAMPFGSKFVPESEGGRHVEVHADATIAWPIIVRAVIERTT